MVQMIGSNDLNAAYLYISTRSFKNQTKQKQELFLVGECTGLAACTLASKTARNCCERFSDTKPKTNPYFIFKKSIEMVTKKTLY